MTSCCIALLSFSFCRHQPMRADFSGGQICSDAGWHQRIYVRCGRDLPNGYAFVYQQKDADHYEFVDKVVTAPGAGTSFWVPQLNRFYVAIPGLEKQEAAVLVFEPV